MENKRLIRFSLKIDQCYGHIAPIYCSSARARVTEGHSEDLGSSQEFIIEECVTPIWWFLYQPLDRMT